jgi:hypothetical protein
MPLFDPHRRWEPQGLCKEEDPELFFPPSGQLNRPPSAKTQAKWDLAKEVCKLCPVMAECQRDTLGEEFGVFGGRDEHERWKVRKRLPARASRWPAEERLEWGSILAPMRDDGDTWQDIMRRTGIPPSLAEALVREWEESQAASAETSKVVDLPLPEPGFRRDLPFPARAGECHAWVRHNGMVTDAWYLGQTPDGKWIFVQTWAGRGRPVCKWVSTKDVKVYQPQPVVIRNYRSRPDAAA